jgi:hypothetical protein
LRALAEDDADLAGIVHALAVRVTTQDARRPVRGQQDAGQHFDGRGLACAIDTDVADDLTRFDIEGDVIYGGLVLMLRTE